MMFGPRVSSGLGPWLSALPVLRCAGQEFCRVSLRWDLSNVFLSNLGGGNGDCLLDRDIPVGPAPLLWDRVGLGWGSVVLPVLERRGRKQTSE